MKAFSSNTALSRRRFLSGVVAPLIGFAIADLLANRAGAQVNVDNTVAGVLLSDRRFQTTTRLIFMTGYTNSLHGRLTVFAPTEEGWDTGDYRSFLSYQDPMSSDAPEAAAVTALLRGLAVLGVHPPSEFGQAQTLRTFNNTTVTVQAGAKQVSWTRKDGTSRSADVVGDAILATNGVIFPVDGVVGQ